MFMLGSYSQNVFMSQRQQHFKTNRTVTLLIISLKSEMLGGGGGVGALNNLQYVLESVDG